MDTKYYYLYKSAASKYFTDPRYTQEDFDKLINDYKATKPTTDLPDVASKEDMFNYVLNERQEQLDNANHGVAKAVSRANGVSPWLVGGGALLGQHLGGVLADSFIGGLQAPNQLMYHDRDGNPDKFKYQQALDKWKKSWWKRALGNLALRTGGFFLGGAIPYLLSRGVEGAWDAGGAILGGAGKAVKGGYNKLRGNKK